MKSFKMILILLAVMSGLIALSPKAITQTATGVQGQPELQDQEEIITHGVMELQSTAEKINFIAPVSIEQALGMAQQQNLSIVLIRHSFSIGDQKFVGFCPLPPGIGADQMRARLQSEYMAFLQNMATSDNTDEGGEAVASEGNTQFEVQTKATEQDEQSLNPDDEKSLQSLNLSFKQALHDAKQSELKIDGMMVEGSSPDVKALRDASPLIENSGDIPEQSSASLMSQSLLNPEVSEQPLASASVNTRKWVPDRGRITVRREPKRKRYALVQMIWNDVSGFNFFSTFEPDLFLNNSSDSKLGPGTYLDRSEGFGRVPKVDYWSTNLPSPYLDSRLGDSHTEVAFTIGSAYANGIKKNNWYINYIRTKYGDANRDNARFSAQLGHRIPFYCFSTFCSYSDQQVQVIGGWKIPVPGAKSWNR
jgi:hypothetical protein